MPWVQMVEEHEARGRMADDFRFISQSYSKTVFDGEPFPVPEIYRISSVVPAYFHFMAEQNRLLTENGTHYCESTAAVPRLMVLFATAAFSSCFH